MMPDLRPEKIEVTASILVLAGGTPECHRLAREGFDANKIARLASRRDVLAREIPGLDGHSETEDLDLTFVDRGEG